MFGYVCSERDESGYVLSMAHGAITSLCAAGAKANKTQDYEIDL